MDDEEKLPNALDMEKRIQAPLVWDSPSICKIQDLHESQYGEALRLIKRHFFREEPMCKACSLIEDQSSVNGYIDLIRSWMKDTTSLIAHSAASGRIIGVAITRINSHSEKTNTFSHVRIYEGECLQKIKLLKNTLIRRTNAYERFNQDTYFRIYILCVHPSYQGKGIHAALLDACVQVAINMKMPAIGGIFTSGVQQSAATNVGFEILSEIRYGLWIVNEEVVFDDPGKGNYSAAFMGMLLPTKEQSQRNIVSSVDLERKSKNTDPYASTQTLQFVD